MTRTRMYRSRRMGLFLAVSGALTCSWVPSARAQNGQLASQCHARSLYVTVDELVGGKLPISVHAGQSLLVTFDQGITVDWAATASQGFGVSQIDNDVIVHPNEHTAPKTRGNVTVKTNRFPLDVDVTVAEPKEATTGYMFVAMRSREEYCQQVLQVPLARLRALETRNIELETRNVELDTKLAGQEDAHRTQTEHDVLTALARHALAQRRYLYAVPDARHPNDGPVSAELTLAEISEEENLTLVFFDVNNHETSGFPLSEVLIANGQAPKRPVDVVVLDMPAAADKQLIGLIPGQRRTRGVFVLPRAFQNAMEPLEIELRQPNGLGSVVAAASTWALRPVTEEDYQRQQRGRQVILGPSTSIGACWIANGPADADPELLTCYGVGAQFIKGFTSTIAFHAEAMGGWTESDGMLATKYGRITTSGLLRFGADKIIPYFRLGIGVQGARIGSSSELGGFLAVGGGVDWRPSGNNLVLGVGLSFENSLNDDNRFRRGFGIALHLGYGWNRDKDALHPD